MTVPEATHVGFADESRWNKGRYRGIGLVTLPVEALAAVEKELCEVLRESNIKECSWEDLRSAKARFAAIKLCKFVVEKARHKVLRIDVLSWDTHDSRHTVQGRDDVANLQRMYHHLLVKVLKDRWPDNSSWSLHPDEHTENPSEYVLTIPLQVEEGPVHRRLLKHWWAEATGAQVGKKLRRKA